MNVISYVERRCEYYINKMDNLLNLHAVGDDWLSLPERPFMQYKHYSVILAELQLVLKNMKDN